MGKTLEYQENPGLPTPPSKKVKLTDKNKTLFIAKNGEQFNLSTEEQAKRKIKLFMSRFKPEEWWAQKVSRLKLGKSDYFTALIVRDFSAEHDKSDMSDRPEHTMWLGREQIGIPALTTDYDEHSETYNKRIPLTMDIQMADGTIMSAPVLNKIGYYSYHPVTKKTIELYKSMCGMTMEDQETEYVFVLAKGGRVVGADDPDLFWEMSCEDAKMDDRNLKKIKRNQMLASAVVSTANDKLK